MNQKKKRAMSLALASAVLLSQSSLVAFAEEPAAPADAGRAADSSQKKTSELLSFTAKSEKPITVSNRFSVVMADSSHNGVKDGDVINESIIIKNPTKRDVTYYIEVEGYGNEGSLGWGGSDFDVELKTANSAENAVTVKAGENQVIDVKVTVKNAKETNLLTFNVYEVPTGDATTGAETGAAVKIASGSHYYYAGNSVQEQKVKISADFELADDCIVSLISRDGGKIYTNSNSDVWSNVNTGSITDNTINAALFNDLQNLTSAVLISGNTICMLTDLKPNLTELKFSSKDNATVTLKANKTITAVYLQWMLVDWGYWMPDSLLVEGTDNKISVPKNLPMCLKALNQDEEHHWNVYSMDGDIPSMGNNGFAGDTEVNFEFADFKVAKTIGVDYSAFTDVNVVGLTNNDERWAVSPCDAVRAFVYDGKMCIPEVLDAKDLEVFVTTVPYSGKEVIYQGVDISTIKDGGTLELNNAYEGDIVLKWDQEWQPGDIPWSLEIDNIVDALGRKLKSFKWSDILNSTVTLTNTVTGRKYTTDLSWGTLELGPKTALYINLPYDMIDGEYDIEVNVLGVREQSVWYDYVVETEGDGIVTCRNYIDLSGSRAPGHNLSFTASAKLGSEFKYWEVSGITLTEEQITDPNLSFVMPNNNVTVKAVFDIVVNTTTSEEAPYVIKIGDSADGRISVSVNDKEGVAAAAEGDKIKLTATPRAGFAFTKWVVEGVKLTDEQLLKSVLEFDMPANDVTVSAEFSAAKYAVKVTTDGHGTATASPEAANAGDTVTLTATPASGYKFSRWTVVKGDITIKDNKFTMPESDVEIKAEFTRVSSGSSGGSSGGHRRPSSSSSSSNDTVTINGKTGGWSDVSAAINTAANGSTISISGTVEVPSDIMSAAAAKKIKIEVKVNDTFTWVLDAANMEPGSKYLSISDAAVNATHKTIKSGETTKSFRVTESKLGKGASIRYNAGKANSGKFANLFIEKNGKLEFVGVAKIDAAGNAVLPVSEAGAYKLVISGETKLVGDLDNSAGLNALDAAVMLKKLVMNEVTADEAAKFDFNGDGKTNALDAAAILKWIVNN